MAFKRGIKFPVMSTLARAIASGCGLLAAHSFQRGEEGRGFGAPEAVSGLLIIGFITIIYHTNDPLSRAGGTIVNNFLGVSWHSACCPPAHNLPAKVTNKLLTIVPAGHRVRL